MLIDLYPEIGFVLGQVVKPSMAVGLTLGMDLGSITETWTESDEFGYEYDEEEYKTTSQALFVGLNLQPSLTLGTEYFYLKGGLKYRYLIENRHYQENDIWDPYDYDYDYYDDEWEEKYHDQSLGILLSVGAQSGGFYFEGGLQIENWVFKHEDCDDWPKWPDEREYMFIGKIGSTF
jgi:hypothetical protein